MMRIRPCREEDLPALRRICLETAFTPVKSETEAKFLPLMYCDPYVLGAQTVCFVAADDSDIAAGYIFCAPDAARFAASFQKDFLPQIRALGPRWALSARLSLLMYRVFARRFPAHLHIDLSDRARHQGVGTALMQALKAQLSSQGVRGLMLCCAAKNENAIRFYLRNGFNVKLNCFGACIMTIEL